MLSIGVGVLAYGMSTGNAANRDFICYWAAGKQLIQHQNPYSPEILNFERRAGFTDPRPFYMRNPPTAFFLAFLAGLFSLKWAAVLWSLALVASLIASVHLIWHMQGEPTGRLHLIGYLFPPALACLLAGQIGIFLLLGVVLFLRWKDTRPFLAGLALIVCTLKPHLFIPFAFVLLIRRHKVLPGFFTAFVLSVAVSFALDPRGWPEYFQMMRRADIQNEFVPTLSLFVRLALHYKAFQFLPAFLACVWAYFKRPEWNLLLVVSVLVAPYAWFTDEAILLPPVMAALYRAKSYVPFVLVMGVALLEVLAGVRINSGLYLWTAPSWLMLVQSQKGAASPYRDEKELLVR